MRPGRVRARKPLALALVLLAANAPGAAIPREVALAKLDEVELAAGDPAGFDERMAIARTALRLAGPGVLPDLVPRLAAGGLRCTTACWALGEIAPEGEAAPDGVARGLRRAAASGDWDCRLGAISALGRLGIATAEAEALQAWRDPFRPPGSDGVVLLALAGIGGTGADEEIARFLQQGGDEAWSVLAVAVALRRGPEAWPLLAAAACSSPDPAVRGTASLALLLLAEPRSGCALAECAASEPDRSVRMLKYQALASGGSPSGLALLMQASRLDPDAEARSAAATLALLPVDPPSRARLSVSSREVRDGLERLVREPGGRGVLADIEAGASTVDLAAITRVMRLLPLRADGGWYDEHARLGRLRARLLCEADPDCDPPPPRIGRPADR